MLILRVFDMSCVVLVWAPAEIFVGGGGKSPKKALQNDKKKTQHREKVAKRSPHDGKGLPYGEKRKKKDPTWKKISKKAPHIAKTFFSRVASAYSRPIPPSGAHEC